MKSYLPILIISLLAYSPSHAEDTALLYKEGSAYFTASRFLDAEKKLGALLEHLKSNNQKNTPIYYYAIELYALSMSEQGKTEGISSLLSERVTLGKAQFGKNSYNTANNLMTLAESFYREGDQKQAIATLDHAERIYRGLDSRYHDRLSFLAKNKTEYLSSPFSSDKIQYDLSAFYSSCESISEGEAITTAERKMSTFIRVGVDYIPKGVWADIFANGNLTGVGVAPDHDQRIIYIPKASNTLKDEWCVLYTKDKKVISAFAHGG